MYRFIRKNRLNNRIMQQRIMTATKKAVERNSENNTKQKRVVKDNPVVVKKIEEVKELVPEVIETPVVEQLTEEVFIEESSPKKQRKGRKHQRQEIIPEQEIVEEQYVNIPEATEAEQPDPQIQETEQISEHTLEVVENNITIENNNGN